MTNGTLTVKFNISDYGYQLKTLSGTLIEVMKQADKLDKKLNKEDKSLQAFSYLYDWIPYRRYRVDVLQPQILANKAVQGCEG